ncbi:hypothetical protein [Halolamina rubra]|uniref:hypothetical protein n=1 Tax=Halolamina rubra TaxID=1380430 RepID=UPI0012AC2247|nr:hypothetical protein [Halolamina rubra]
MTGSDANDTGIGYPKPEDRPFGLRACKPPARNAVPLDKEARRQELQNERYEAWKARDELEIWGDDPGLGKTTNIAIGAEQQEDTLVFYFPQHENAHEFRADAAKPDPHLHLKGPDQPIESECMDAKVAGTRCETHGNRDNCPRMCSVFDLPSDNAVRERFELIAEERGTKTAHDVVNPHDDDEDCPWEDQWDTLEKINDRDGSAIVVTVFNYMSSVNTVGYNVLDDVQSLFEDTTHLSQSDLENVSQTLAELSTDSAISSVIDEIALFITDVIDVLRQNRRQSDDPLEFRDLDPPTISIEQDTWIGRRIGDEIDPVAEALAWVKHAYHEMLLGGTVSVDGVLQRQVDLANWDYVPLGLDAVFAAAAEAGLDDESARRAIATSPGVEDCPACGNVSKFCIRTGRSSADPLLTDRDVGMHVCGSCGWHENDDPLTETVGELPRVIAWADEDDPRKRRPEYELYYQKLPLTSDLPAPSQTLILDATPTKQKYALLFGLDKDDVVVTGNEPVRLNANITQIYNGQYHQHTLENARSERKEQFNTVIGTAAECHDGVLVVSHRGNDSFLDVDEHDWMYFHAGRGLNRTEPEAVVVVGAPHANEKDLRRKAKLLAVDREDVRIGGIEYSSRRNEEGELAAEPPIYRKYYYEDETGSGRAIATKHYSGLVGDLFRDTREHEIVQLAHRLRPAISDERKFIYLLTNVPTELPVDTLADLSELADPIYEQVGISEGAIKLLRICVELYDHGRAGTKDDLFYEWDKETFTATVNQFYDLATNHSGGVDVTKRQFRDYLDELRSLGLVERDGYQQRAGWLHRVDLPTSKQALLVVDNNSNFEVDAVWRLSEKIESTDGSAEWVEWATEQFGVSGEPDTESTVQM